MKQKMITPPLNRVFCKLGQCLLLLIKCITVFCPWPIKRLILVKCFHYEIAKTARIGLAFFFPKHLIMEEGAVVKHFNVAINLDNIHLKQNSLVDRSNWITGFPTGTDSQFFSYDKGRKSLLVLGCNAVITKHHHFDCTNAIEIGNFTTIAGYNSQFLTHSVNIYTNRQESYPIHIGSYCFVSTRVTVLGGASLPDESVLGATALLNKDYSNDKPLGLYVGVPAVRKKEITDQAKYFSRNQRDVI